MQKLAATLMFIITSLATALAADINHLPSLDDLDKVVAEQQIYADKHEREITNTRRSIARATTDEKRFEETQILHNQFSSYRVDSALHYARRMLSIAHRMQRKDLETRSLFCIMGTMIQAGMYKEAEDAMDAIDHGFIETSGDDIKKDYYYACNTLYDALEAYTIDATQARSYRDKAMRYKDSILAVSGNELLVKANVLLKQGRAEEGLRYLTDAYRKCPADDRYLAYVAFAISDHYRALGDRNREKQFLIVSAISDIKSAVKEYIALRRLASMLYEDGDIDHAYRYMRRSLDDALFCNARLRTIETSQVLPVIDHAYQLSVERKHRQLAVALIGISVLMIVVIGLFLYARRQAALQRRSKEALSVANGDLNKLNRQLKDSNVKLNSVNANLLEANTIKETYIVKFMTECSTYIDKLDRYRTRLNKKAISGDTKGLMKDLKEGSLIEREVDEFQRSFDETFLELFPHFVDDFNKLFPDGVEFPPKRDGRMSTTLRIFALYRLGITDNERIAAFLRCSMATIYSYRSRTRAKAISPDRFESDVMAIESAR